VTLLERTASVRGSKTSTTLPDQRQTVHLQVFFVLFIPALEALLLALEWRRWGFDGSYLGFYVAAGASLPVGLLLVVACINLLASKFRWPYVWAIPNLVFVQAPSILVGIGFVFGFIAGILLWT